MKATPQTYAGLREQAVPGPGEPAGDRRDVDLKHRRHLLEAQARDQWQPQQGALPAGQSGEGFLETGDERGPVRPLEIRQLRMYRRGELLGRGPAVAGVRREPLGPPR